MTLVTAVKLNFFTKNFFPQKTFFAKKNSQKKNFKKIPNKNLQKNSKQKKFSPKKCFHQKLVSPENFFHTTSPPKKIMDPLHKNIVRIAKRCPENITLVVKCVQSFFPKVLRQLTFLAALSSSRSLVVGRSVRRSVRLSL